ncbi:MAG: glutamine synthetase [Alphaproteobacteria bacterium]|nr:glutamine synthetase [Alphaproteobacteria bacterium]
MKNDLIDWLEQNSITEVECLVSDMAGIPRGKIVPVKKFKSAIKEQNLRLPEYVFGQMVTGDYIDSDVLRETNSDIILVPDMSGVRFVPWYMEPTAQVIHDAIYHDGSVVDVAPRQVLKNVIAKFEEMGLKPIIAPELEFFLVRKESQSDTPLSPPIGKSGRAEMAPQAYGIDAVNEFDPLFEDIYDYCDIQNLDVDTLSHEAGAAQMEINFNHGEVLDLADQTFIFKRTVRQAALDHNVHATFMAKPMQSQPGSAMHVHVSVIDQATGKNIFSDDDGEPTDRFNTAIGGMQRYLSAAMPLMAPYVNSYRRLLSGEDSPTNLAWGVDNRTVGLRVPRSTPQQRRIENRIPGADANPYLAIAATLATVYLGLKNETRARREQTKSAEDLTTIPRNLDAALDKLEKETALHDVLGDEFVRVFLEIKRAEGEAYLQVISPWEREYLLLNV